MKTTVFNLIILDESGSMGGVTEQTIAGCNETINVAKTQAEQNAEALHSIVSIYAFQSGGPVPSRYILKNEPAKTVRHITGKDYLPHGMTPLLDAVGSTLTELKEAAATHEDATGIITIITDGHENASREYTWKDVANLISGFKEMGWTVNLIGANIDVDKMGEMMHIDNRMAFQTSKEGTDRMWKEYSALHSNATCAFAMDASIEDAEERVKMRKKRSGKFFG